jgi:hypothetical protein
MTPVVALLGAGALWLTYLWLASAILCSFIAARKGYDERIGLASGLVLSVVGVVVWLVIRPKPDSRWKLQGALGRRKGGETVAEARARMAGRGEAGSPRG